MNNIEILEEFIKHYKEVQEKYKDDEIQAEIERSCYFEEVPAEAIENLIQENKELKKQNIELLTRLKADGLIERDKYWISKIKEVLYNGTLDAKGWGCEDGAYCVEKQFKHLLEEGE